MIHDEELWQKLLSNIEYTINSNSKEDNLPFDPYGKFSVIIAYDERPQEEINKNGRLDLKFASYIGSYRFPDITDKMDPFDEDSDALFFSECGQYIFSSQCIWRYIKPENEKNPENVIELAKIVREEYQDRKKLEELYSKIIS